MKYNIKSNWFTTFNLILKRPIVTLPFIIIAFLECLALEFIYFLPRPPIVIIAGPIIRKFFGEAYLHYPSNLIILPRLFYYAEVVIYVFIGALLTAVSVNIFKNIKMGLPLKSNAIIKNVMSRYLSFFLYGIITVVLIGLINKLDALTVSKFMHLIDKHVPQIIVKLAPIKLALFLFLSNLILDTLILLVIPIIVLEKKSIFKAFVNSVYMGIRNFPSIFKLIFLPFLLYLPTALLRSIFPALINKTFPEVGIFITLAGIIIGIFVDSFVTICMAQFLLDKNI